MTDRERIKALIMSATNKEIERYVQMIVERQTPTEKGRKQTIKQNDKGLNKLDAPIITSYYRQIERGVSLLEFQIKEMKNKLPKYWKQYLEMGL